MSLLFLLLLVICIYKSQLYLGLKSKANLASYDYLSPQITTSIKGIFIIILLLSHISQYIRGNLSDSILNTLYFNINFVFIGQSVTVMFLFYSGYGVMYSAAHKGDVYIKSIPKNRFLKTLFHFDLVIIVFLLLNTIFGEKYGLLKILLSFIGWEDVGNYNWYIFVILVLYLLSYISLTLFKNKKIYAVISTFVLTSIFIVFLHQTKSTFWWDTAICYPIGMLYFLLREKIDNLLKKGNFLYYIIFVALFFMHVVFMFLRTNDILLILKHISFLFMVVLLTMKIKVSNPILSFCGKHLFSIFMLQRLPMIVLSHFGIEKSPILFLVLTIVITIAISVPFDYMLKKFDNVIFNKPSKVKI